MKNKTQNATLQKPSRKKQVSILARRRGMNDRIPEISVTMKHQQALARKMFNLLELKPSGILTTFQTLKCLFEFISH